MPVPPPCIPKAPVPTKIFFDPFNSSSTGHQTSASRLAGSTSWRESRTYKLANQFQDASGRGGSQHLSDLVGAGSKDFGKDGRKENGDWEKGAPGLRTAGWQDIRGLMSGSRKRNLDGAVSSNASMKSKNAPSDAHSPALIADFAGQGEHFPAIRGTAADTEPVSPPKQLPRVFRGLTIYINGSTAPLISDHKLKNLFISHGGKICLGLARRSVTHIILGDTGLSAGKTQKEIRKISGEPVRYVTAQWVVDSVKAGRRKSEGDYLPKELRIGGSRQQSVGTVFSKKGRR